MLWTMSMILGMRCGMVGSWFEWSGLMSWCMVVVGGHLFWRLLLWSRAYRVQLGHMFEGWCVMPMWHVGHRLLES